MYTVYRTSVYYEDKIIVDWNAVLKKFWILQKEKVASMFVSFINNNAQN